MISAFFQASGNVDVAREQLMMVVRGPRMTGRQSLMTCILILSGPGDLFVGIDEMMLRTSEQVTCLKVNNSSWDTSVGVMGGFSSMF